MFSDAYRVDADGVLHFPLVGGIVRLLVFLALVGSTVVKVAGLVPVYYDPASTVYAFSGLFFAHSINRHGLLRPISPSSASSAHSPHQKVNHSR